MKHKTYNIKQKNKIKKQQFAICDLPALNLLNGRFANAGISLVMSLLILSLILSVAVSVSTIFTGEIKNSRIFEHSALAYYAADSGAEAAIYLIKRGLTDNDYTCANDGDGFTLLIGNQISCQIKITGNGANIKSTGLYNNGEAQRKVEITL